MAVIAMTREIGTLGKDVAAGLAERLGLDVIHHELIKPGAGRLPAYGLGLKKPGRFDMRQ
jgi:hypothetical protein